MLTLTALLAAGVRGVGAGPSLMAPRRQLRAGQSGRFMPGGVAVGDGLAHVREPHHQARAGHLLPATTNAGQQKESDPMPERKPIPIRPKHQRTIEAVLNHQLDANAYALDGTPDALKQAQYHMRKAARLIDGYLGGKAA